uniref:response regulator n=1 Tax=Flavobacterium sp. TaxID=239 RepID=UPI004049C3C6
MGNIEILIIDDDTIFLMIQKKILRSEGIENNITTFSNMDDAYDFLKKSDEAQKFLVFLDINLANTTAWDFLNLMVQHDLDSKLSVVIASASMNEKDLDIVNQYECVFDFIEKPIKKEFIAKLKQGILMNSMC